MDRSVQLARDHAGLYEGAGLLPIPSEMLGRKKPMVRFRDRIGHPTPEHWWSDPRLATTNIQVACGRVYDLVVVDLDGPEAIRRWEAYQGPIEELPTPVVSRNRSESVHIWYRFPDDRAPIPSEVLWKNGKHSQIDLLSSGKLATAPPSIHVETRERYRFLPGQSLWDFPVRAVLPCGVAERARTIKTTTCLTSEVKRVSMRLSRANRAPAQDLCGRYDRGEVLDALERSGMAIPLAREHGLVCEDGVGWVPARCVSRDDHVPSASIHSECGRYSEEGKKSISYFDLLVLLGAASTWREAIALVGNRLHVPKR